MNDKFMDLAIKQAKKAYKKGEIPVGAVIVYKNKVIAKAHNMIEHKKNATLHAEIIALLIASKKLKNWRLNDCDLYVTLEPCFMCKAAIELSRIRKVYYSTKHDKNITINNDKYKCLNVYDNETKKLIQDFFKIRR